MIELKAEYNGHEIKWEDYVRAFKISLDGVEIKRLPDVEACVKYIDQKLKQKFKRVPIFLKPNWKAGSKFIPCEATSVIDKDYIWVSGKKGRSKERIDNAILDTEANRAITEVIHSKKQEIIKLNNEIDVIENSAEKLTAEIMIKEG